MRAPKTKHNHVRLRQNICSVIESLNHFCSTSVIVQNLCVALKEKNTTFSHHNETITMRWFEGGIADAVSFSRQKASIFVVYIAGNDAESERFTNFIDTQVVSDELSTDQFTCVKIEAESREHHQFTEIYKKVNAPSIFFIGKGGVPLEIVESIKDVKEILFRIERAVQKSGLQLVDAMLINRPKPSSDLIAKEQKNNIESAGGVNKAELEGNDEAGSTFGPSTSTQQEVQDGAKVVADVTKNKKTELSSEEKIEKAKELLEKAKEAKKKEEEEKEKLKEIERRKMGQDVQKLKRWQEDQELKLVIEAREKEKKEQQAARQRVLEQIQQDKADRAARFSNNPQQPPATPGSSTQQPQQKTPPTTTNIARIQFKLPDGGSHVHEFSPDDTLLEVREYIRGNIALPFNSFMLATVFPKREFDNDDDAKTLRELELLPSAVLLILPLSQSGTVATQSSSYVTLLFSYFWPVMYVYNYLRAKIFGAPRSAERDSNDSNKRPPDTTGESSRPLPKRRADETTAIKRQGNVHRLTDKRDSDDENNTWNGNSTQQM